MSRALERSLDILDCLAAGDEPLRLSQLAGRIGAERSNTLRLLRSLQARGYVERDESKRYSLGLTALLLARVVLRRLDVVEAGQEILQALGHATGEAVHLAVLQGTHIVYLGRVESAAPVRVTNEVGQRLPAHCTAVGKSLLAYLPASELQRLFPTGRLPTYTSHTLSTLRALMHDLELARERDTPSMTRSRTKECAASRRPYAITLAQLSPQSVSRPPRRASQTLARQAWPNW